MMKLPPLVRAAAATVSIIAATLPFTSQAESLPELWKRPVKGEFTSAKTSLALEYCIGSVTSELGSPHLLHGEGVTDLWVGRPFAIRIEEAANTRKVSYTASAAYDDRVDRAIRGCL